MLLATGGTILATELALKYGWSINLGGGYHHAYGDSGGGFCVYADISIAIKKLRKVHKKNYKVMIVDLDAHQGNGHERDFTGDKNTYIFDMYGVPNYPNDIEARKGISKGIQLHLFMEDKEYLTLLKTELPKCFDSCKPELVLYNAGTDILAGDSIGAMSISPKGIIQRDEFVFQTCFERKVPIAMVFSGGYQKSNARIIADSILHLNRKFDLFKQGNNEIQLDV